MLLPRQRPSEQPPLRGYVDPKIPNPDNEDDAPIIIYGYTPTLALAILALILYAALLLLHALQLFYFQRRPHKTSSSPTTSSRPFSSCLPFSVLLTLATLLEFLGYIFRLQSSPPPVGDPYKTINFILQYFFIVVAPVFVSAGIYTIVTSLIRWLGTCSLPDQTQAGKESEEEFNPLRKYIRRRGIVAVFVFCDVVATVVQVAGAALIGSAESNRKSPDTANHILLAGLAFQCFSFLLFLLLFGVLVRRTWHLLSRPEFQQREHAFGEAKIKILGSLKGFVVVVAGASGLVYLRTVFRLAETAEGVYGYASTHEAFFGALEFAPVVVAIAALGVWHPGWYVGKGKERGGDGMAVDEEDRAESRDGEK